MHSVKFIGWSVALTVILSLLVYFFLPDGSPTPLLVSVLAAIAMCIVAFTQWIFHKLYIKSVARMTEPRRKEPIAPKQNKSSKKHKNVTHLLVLAFVSLALICGCAESEQHPIVITTGPAPPPPPPPPTKPPTDVIHPTGTAFLLANQHENPGYGLYSYVLLVHHPSDSEKAGYRALLTAMLGLPTAQEVQQYAIKSYINITYLLVKSVPSDWAQRSLESRVDFLIENYDYARATVIAASIPNVRGPGPTVVSYLQPITFGSNPHPILYQDLSHAQPTLMTAYVQQFVEQAGQGRFWEPNVMSQFALTLRNILQTAAVSLGMSKDAVKDWITFFK